MSPERKTLLGVILEEEGGQDGVPEAIIAVLASAGGNTPGGDDVELDLDTLPAAVLWELDALMHRVTGGSYDPDGQNGDAGRTRSAPDLDDEEISDSDEDFA